MTKKKKMIAIVSVLLLIILSFFIGQTYSKYTAQIKGEGIAEVAKWSFLVNGQEEQVQTIRLSSTYNNETLVNNKIAPGTTGNFEIVIDGTGSEVGIDYKVQFEDITSKPQNLKFIYDNKEYNSIKEIENVLVGNIAATDEEKVKEIVINWKWDYETGSGENEIYKNDIIDTQNGKEISEYAFNVIVQGTQVIPQT